MPLDYTLWPFFYLPNVSFFLLEEQGGMRQSSRQRGEARQGSPTCSLVRVGYKQLSSLISPVLKQDLQDTLSLVRDCLLLRNREPVRITGISRKLGSDMRQRTTGHHTTEDSCQTPRWLCSPTSAHLSQPIGNSFLIPFADQLPPLTSQGPKRQFLFSSPAGPPGPADESSLFTPGSRNYPPGNKHRCPSCMLGTSLRSQEGFVI